MGDLENWYRRSRAAALADRIERERRYQSSPTSHDRRHRRLAAEACGRALDLTIPVLLDGMNDAAAEAFAAWPERIFIVREGVVAYCGGPGPYEFDPGEAGAALEEMLSGR